MPISLSGSLVLTGSITTTGGITISGSILSASYSATSSFSNDFTVLGNLTVFGTQSVQYITSSQLNVSDNVITVNVASPGVRFGGLSVFDSGSQSSEATASLFWDSQQNHWIYQRESGSTYDGGMIMSGPRNSAGLGNESGTTSCMLLVGQGGDHLTSSMIYHSSTVTCFPSCMIVGGATTINVPTDNTTVGIFHAGGGTANRGLKISTFACTNDNAGVRLDAQTTVGGATLALATAGNDRLTISCIGAATFTNTETTLNFNPQTSLLAGYNYLNFGGGSIMYRNASDLYFGSNAKYGSAGTLVAKYTTAQGMGMLTMNGGALNYQANNTSVTAGTAYAVPVRFAINGDGNVGIGTSSPSTLLDTIKNDIAGTFLNSTADVVARFGNCNINPGNHYSTGIQVFQGCGTLGSGYAAGFLVADNNTATAQQSNTVSLISPSSMSGGVSLIAADASAPIRMFTGGFICERLRINNCGQLLLGTSSSNGFTFRISSNANNNSADPRKLVQFGNDCVNAITAYMYIGSFAGIDWLVGKDTCGAGDYRFNLSLYTGEPRMTLYTNGNYSFAGSNVSDIRLKCNINSLCINAIDKINRLVPKCYYMEDKMRYGFIAQDVKTTLPDLISGEEKEKEYLGLDYNGVLAVAVKAIQELNEKVIALENK